MFSRKLILSVLLGMCSFAAYSQNEIDGNDITPVKLEEGRYQWLTGEAGNEKPLSGLCRIYCSDIQHGRAVILADYTDGLKDGNYEYYENEHPVKGTYRLVQKGSYKEGRKQGAFMEYFPDGSVEKITEFVNGRKEGLMQQFLNGTNQMVLEYTYSDNILNGPYKLFYDNGSLREEGRYEQGEMVFRVEYCESGEVKTAGEMTPQGWKIIENSDPEN